MGKLLQFSKVATPTIRYLLKEVRRCPGVKDARLENAEKISKPGADQIARFEKVQEIKGGFRMVMWAEGYRQTFIVITRNIDEAHEWIMKAYRKRPAQHLHPLVPSR